MSAAGKVNRSRRCDKAFFLITLTIVLIPFSFVNLYSASDNESHNRAQDRVTLRWFDAGLDLSDGTGSADWRLKPEFRPFRRNLDKFMGTIPSDGQIFIPTPSAEKAPRTDAEWKTLREHIFHGTHLRIKQGLARGIKDFVIGTAMMPEGKAQSTAISGPRVSLKRSNQFQYAKALLESLSKIKQDLASKSVKVTNQGLIVGKGGSALIRALPEASRGSLDGLITVDSHASLGDILRAGTVLEDKFALIATGQSTPENNIVSSGADNLLKLLRPPVQMFRIATSFDQMVSEMSRENSKAIKLAELILTENSRLRFSETEEMTIRDLLKRILDSLGSESRGNGLIRNPSELPSTLSAIQETVNQIASDPEPPLGPYDWVQIADELSSLRPSCNKPILLCASAS